MRPGLTISVIGHVVALGFGLIAISATPLDVPQVDSLPVSFISDKDFSQMTQGVKNAPKPKEDPKPLADKIELPKPADQTADKVAKQENAKVDNVENENTEVYIGDATWEERTWKELVKMRETLFWARVGCLR